MKLKIEHLAPYLPYRLIFQYSNTELPPEEMTCDNIGMLIAQQDQFKKVIHKLILHDLSDLTKEIENYGEKFIPIDELNESFNCSGTLKYLKLNSGIYKGNKSLICLQSSPNDDIEVSEYLQSINKLFEWHFDVFNLIENGLALDYNDVYRLNRRRTSPKEIT